MSPVSASALAILYCACSCPLPECQEKTKKDVQWAKKVAEDFLEVLTSNKDWRKRPAALCTLVTGEYAASLSADESWNYVDVIAYGGYHDPTFVSSEVAPNRCEVIFTVNLEPRKGNDNLLLAIRVVRESPESVWKIRHVKRVTQEDKRGK